MLQEISRAMSGRSGGGGGSFRGDRSDRYGGSSSGGGRDRDRSSGRYGGGGGSSSYGSRDRSRDRRDRGDDRRDDRRDNRNDDRREREEERPSASNDAHSSSNAEVEAEAEVSGQPASSSTWDPAKEAENDPTWARIYVSNLPSDVTVTELQEMFGAIGVIAREKQKRGYKDQWPFKIKVYADTSGASKGDAVITYEDSNAARTAPSFFDGAFRELTAVWIRVSGDEEALCLISVVVLMFVCVGWWPLV